VQRGLTTADAPPADKDEGRGEREQTRGTDHQHHVPRQRRVVRRRVHVKLTTAAATRRSSSRDEIANVNDDIFDHFYAVRPGSYRIR